MKRDDVKWPLRLLFRPAAGAAAFAFCMRATAASAERAAEWEGAQPMSYLTGYGERADPVVLLTWGLLLISVAVCLVIGALVLIGIFRRRQERWVDDPTKVPASRPEHGLRFIGIGVSISTAVLFGALIWTMVTLSHVTQPERDPRITVEISGHQWWWEVRYLDRRADHTFRTANEIHIPVGEPVRIKLKASDVIHSFWVPALSGKTDLIPGQENNSWIQASKPGIYRGQCAEYCGFQHAKMAFAVVAQPREDFERWVSRQIEPAHGLEGGTPSQGKDHFAARCGVCHTVRGTRAGGAAGPDLTHLMSRKTIAAGILANNPANLRRWIEHTQQIKPGSRMPDLDLPPDVSKKIVAYLLTLE